MLRQIAFLISLALLSSCATVLAEKTRSFVVTSSPPGAEIAVNGAPYGQTPQRINVPESERLVVTVRKDGFHNGGCYVNTKIGAVWLIADALFFWLVVPLVVDFLTSNWSRLETGYCTVNLAPLAGA